jgi:hypothetical protein
MHDLANLHSLDLLRPPHQFGTKMGTFPGCSALRRTVPLRGRVLPAQCIFDAVRSCAKTDIVEWLGAGDPYGGIKSRLRSSVSRGGGKAFSVYIAKSTLEQSKMLFTLLARAWSEIIRTCGEIMGTFLDFLCFEMLCFRLLFGFGQLICARLLVGTDDAKC